MFRPGMKVVFVKEGRFVYQQIGDVGVILGERVGGSYVVGFNNGGRIVRWFVSEDQIQLDTNEVLKSLKKCLKSEI